MSAKVTEREVTAWISQEINKILDAGGFPFQESTVETSLSGKKARFPDIILWHSRKTETAFIFFELKSPGGTEDPKILIEKAKRLKVNYCFTYNFQEGVLYEISDESLIRLKTYPTYIMDSLEKWKRGDIQARLKHTFLIFLEDIKTLYEKGNLHEFIPDKVFFVSLFREGVDKLSPTFGEYIKAKIKDRQVKTMIDGWISKQGFSNVGDEEAYETLARQWAYSLMTKILFYSTLRKYYNDLPDLIKEEKSPESMNDILHNAFKEAEKIDWHAVFEESLIDKIGFPKNADGILQHLLKDLKNYHFGLLKEDVIGEIFEELIPEEERHNLGQYFTREDLVDFIIGFIANDDKGVYGDPTCGSGTFLNRLYSRLRWLSGNKLEHKELLSKLWGIDIGNFPATLATVNLFRQKISDYRNFPHIIPEDFFKINPGDKFLFPPPKVSKQTFEKIEEPIPYFDGLVGNFPYIRQELIEKKDKGYKTFLTKVLAQEWLFEYPDVFTIKIPKNVIDGIKKSQFEKQINEWVDRGLIKLKLSGQADIYAYLFFHSASFIKENGRLGFLTSNSWLDVAYGVEIKRFFLKKFKIIAIVGSWIEPWFEDASVNTVFTILERCDSEKERMNHNVKFVKLKKTLKELIPYRDLSGDEQKRWNVIESLVSKINTADVDFKELKGTKWINKLKGIQSKETDDFRIRMVRQSDLMKELEEKEELAKWGKYLRAPDVYFEILKKAKDKLVPLKDIAEVRFGIKTGINDFFYLEPTGEPASKQGYMKVKNACGWIGEIEEEFLKPVIKSPKEAPSITIDPSKLKYHIFICNWSKKDLKKAGKRGALSYIEWGEKQRTKKGVPWAEVPSTKGRRYWWGLGERKFSDFICMMSWNDRFVFWKNKHILSDARLYDIYNIKNMDEPLLGGMLNSTLSSCFVEIGARANLGDGALDFKVYEASNEIFVVLPNNIPDSLKKKIKKYYREISGREIKNIFEEIKMKDRQKLDAAVLEAMGLNPKEYLPKIYEGITKLVKERLQLPKMRKKIKKQKTKRSIEQIKKIVEEDILSGGIKSFPEGFIDMKKYKFEEIPLSGLPVKMGNYFMGTYDLVADGNRKIYNAKDIFEAKFLLYASKINQYVIQKPKNKKAIQSAVKEYEKYIKELNQKLINRAFKATHDHTQAERIANEILKENGVKM